MRPNATGEMRRALKMSRLAVFETTAPAHLRTGLALRDPK